MKTNRLSKKIESILNNQINKEAEAAQIYLSFATWADGAGYPGVADFLYSHYEEEREHMMKFIKYMGLRGARAKIGALKAPAKDPQNLYDCFEKLFQYEVATSKSIDDVVNLAHEEKDWATFHFTQWFVQEQIEEEALILEILNKLEIAGGTKASGQALLYFDSKIKSKGDDSDLNRDIDALHS